MIKRTAVLVLLIILLLPGLASCSRTAGTATLSGSTGGNIPRDSYGEPIWRFIGPKPAPPQTPPGIIVRQHVPRDISPSG